MKKRSDIKAFGGLNGFTLIELLVVVLIIGILAAVALPQYNKAVKKAQGKEVFVAIDALDKALSAYALEHGNLMSQADPDHFVRAEELSVQIPTLKHFLYSGTCSGSSCNRSTFSGLLTNRVNLITPKSDVDVAAVWDTTTGRRLRALCTGKSCADYFNCNWKQETFCQVSASPCPAVAIGMATFCYLD